MSVNPRRSIFQTADSYKYGHSSLIRPDAVSQYNYLESRGGKYKHVLWHGMQYIIKEFLMTVPTKTEAIRYETLAKLHGVPFDREMWDYIIELGYYPIEICSIAEGRLVPAHHVLATFESTDPKAVGIVGFLETLFMKVWMPTTVATKSYYVRKMLEKYGAKEWAQFAYHNFGNRSCTSEEQAMIAGFAHLTQFMGTDSFGSLAFAEDYYNQPTTEAAGYSVLATEHPITTMYLEENEEQFIYDTILAHPEAAILSFVADSYDVYRFVNFVTAPGSRIRKLLDSREGQKLVIRPDSGKPLEVIPKILELMMKNGVDKNIIEEKIFFLNYGLLWGDGVTPEAMDNILLHVTMAGFAAENFVFGSGTDLVNNQNRDTNKFAIKCSSVKVQDDLADGMGNPAYTDIDVYKDPITDPGKASKKGRVTTWLDTETKTFISGVRSRQPNMHCIDVVVPIFRNGRLLVNTSLSEIREVTE